MIYLCSDTVEIHCANTIPCDHKLVLVISSSLLARISIEDVHDVPGPPPRNGVDDATTPGSVVPTTRAKRRVGKKDKTTKERKRTATKQARGSAVDDAPFRPTLKAQATCHIPTRLIPRKKHRQPHPSVRLPAMVARVEE